MTMDNSPAERQQYVAPAATGLSSFVGFFFSFRIFIMLLSVRFLGTTEQVGVEVSLAFNFLLLIFVAISNNRGNRSREAKHAAARKRTVGLNLLCFSCISLLWSATASMPAAIVYWCAMTADVAMVALLLRLGPVREVATSIMKGYVLGACVIAIIAWLLPAQSDLRLGDERAPWSQPNRISLCVCFILCAISYSGKSSGRWVLLRVSLQ